MAFVGDSDYVHGSGDAMGVLLVNLGTPDAPTPAALRRYLGEFLWDPRVDSAPALVADFARRDSAHASGAQRETLREGLAKRRLAFARHQPTSSQGTTRRVEATYQGAGAC